MTPEQREAVVVAAACESAEAGRHFQSMRLVGHTPAAEARTPLHEYQCRIDCQHGRHGARCACACHGWA